MKKLKIGKKREKYIKYESNCRGQTYRDILGIFFSHYHLPAKTFLHLLIVAWTRDKQHKRMKSQSKSATWISTMKAFMADFLLSRSQLLVQCHCLIKDYFQECLIYLTSNSTDILFPFWKKEILKKAPSLTCAVNHSDL